MKAIVIDDERLALGLLASQLEATGITVASLHSDPVAGMTAALESDADVVFLDIHMPELNGLELAERLLEQKPSMEVVFVTAYDEHAIKAFELNALDYIVKPVQAGRLAKTVQRLRSRHRESTAAAPDAGQRVRRIRLFGELTLELEDGSVTTPRWRTSKALELFAYLLHVRGAPVQRDVLAETLWPELDPDKTYPLLYTTVYQVRQTLGGLSTGLRIRSEAGTYKLELPGVAIDVVEWLNTLQTLPALNDQTAVQHRALLDMQRGDYLAGHDFAWAEADRQRFRTLWLQQALQVGEHDLAAGNYATAVALYTALQMRHRDAEQAYFGLMQAYAAQGHRAGVHAQYTTLVDMMEREFALPPARHISGWYERWQQASGTQPSGKPTSGT